jgi:PleD family two-component response regulator
MWEVRHNPTATLENNPRSFPQQLTFVLVPHTFVRDGIAAILYTLKWSYIMPAVISSPQKTESPLAAGRKPVLLLVESDASTLELYHRVLDLEFTVVSRTDEAGVLEAFFSEAPQAIILEPALGGGRGWGIFSAIQSAARERLTPVIVCSTLDERKRGLEMGAAAYLVKPVLPGVLIETIRRTQRTGQTG